MKKKWPYPVSRKLIYNSLAIIQRRSQVRSEDLQFSHLLDSLRRLLPLLLSISWKLVLQLVYYPDLLKAGNVTHGVSLRGLGARGLFSIP